MISERGGEERVLAALRQALGARVGGPGVEIGIGDDAAVLRPPPGRLVATVDMLVEGQHFLRRGPMAGQPADVGWQAMAVNLSDVAAMGGRPLWALCSLGLPDDLEAGEVESLYAGMAEAAEAFGVAVVGGNLARLAERLVVDVTVLGVVDRPLCRGRARPGDYLCMTGRVGAAAAGLHLARTDAGKRDGSAPLLAALRRPQPRVREGIALGALGGDAIRSACDLSDGLAVDLCRLLAPGVDAVLWQDHLPVPDAVRATAEAAGVDPLEWVLHGGGDYELACAVAPAAIAQAQAALVRVGQAPLHTIGICEAAEPGGRLYIAPRQDGTRRPVARSGWDPFRQFRAWR